MSLRTRDNRHREIFADVFCREFFYLGMAGDGLHFTGHRIFPKGVCRTFPMQLTTMFHQMFNQCLSFHANSISSILDSEEFLRASCFWLSKTNITDSRKLIKHSSTVSPCPFASGISAQVAAKPVSPSVLQSWIRAVSFMAFNITTHVQQIKPKGSRS